MTKDYNIDERQFYREVPEDWSKEYFSQIERQIGVFTFKEQEKLKNYHIAVLGCGGGGSAVLELLVRMGCENLTICDFDKWELSNLARSHAFRRDVGKYKVDSTEILLKEINPNVNIRKFYRLDEENVSQILSGIQIAFGIMDDTFSHLILARECRKNNIDLIISLAFPFIHTMWFTKDSITFEEWVGVSPNMSIEKLRKRKKKITTFLAYKYFRVFKPQIMSRINRNAEGFKRHIKERKFRTCAVWVRLNYTNVAFELVFSGILNIKKKILAPNSKVFDYYDWKVVLIDGNSDTPVYDKVDPNQSIIKFNPKIN